MSNSSFIHTYTFNPNGYFRQEYEVTFTIEMIAAAAIWNAEEAAIAAGLQR